jgi:UDP-N-acetylmuramyl pentapeptide phosphotransferase/UDP-N-acetylglucosamine-1-phosphate transferase
MGLVPTLLTWTLLSFAAAFAWRHAALRRGWVDWPDARRLHSLPTPRGGGIGIVLVLLLALWQAPALPGTVRVLAAGLGVIAAGGLIDDVRPMAALPKLALQILGAALIGVAVPLSPQHFGDIGSVLAAAAVVLGLVNVWNFMDGSNGLATSQAVLVGAAVLVAALVAPSSRAPFVAMALGMALVCGGLGFLPLNLPKARVFLGDVGSQAIGAAVAAAGLLLARDGDLAFAATLWLPPSAFLIDAGLTLAGRLRRRERIWEGHRLHLFQRAVAAGWSHAGICALYAAWTLLACAIAAALQVTGSTWAPAVVGAVYAAGMLLYLWMGRRWSPPAREGSKA